jgi:hypothetical protein
MKLRALSSLNLDKYLLYHQYLPVITTYKFVAIPGILGIPLVNLRGCEIRFVFGSYGRVTEWNLTKIISPDGNSNSGGCIVRKRRIPLTTNFVDIV